MEKKDVMKWYEKQLKGLREWDEPEEEMGALAKIVNSFIIVIPFFAVFTNHWLGEVIAVLWVGALCLCHVEADEKIRKLEKKLANNK